ncbi:hypothetical protein HanPSC8_Chr05g0191951 [Helianthus annuus]|nr:hypothetical protein HanLR1_Chr05g0167521 [Helianthus annuus]KAJ0921475.1 hypothetical protein HanPSC8_Chr05g0191951 [Helianthus annuus]
MVAVTVFRRPAMAAESGGRDGSSAEFMFKSGNQKSRTRVDLCFAPGHQGSDQSHQIKRCRISDQTHQTLHQATGHPRFRIPQIRESRFRRGIVQLLHCQNYGTVGIEEPTGFRVISGRSFFRSLSFLLPLCNEDTGPVTPALIFRGVT